MSGGASPTEWQVDLDFSSLLDIECESHSHAEGSKNALDLLRRLAARGLLEEVSSMLSSRTGQLPAQIAYTKVADLAQPEVRRRRQRWSTRALGHRVQGNFLGRHDSEDEPNRRRRVTVSYNSQISHRLFLGTRYTFEAGTISVVVDSDPAQIFDLYVPAEDFLARIDLGASGTPGHSHGSGHSHGRQRSLGRQLLLFRLRGGSDRGDDWLTRSRF